MLFWARKFCNTPSYGTSLHMVSNIPPLGVTSLLLRNALQLCRCNKHSWVITSPDSAKQKPSHLPRYWTVCDSHLT